MSGIPYGDLNEQRNEIRLIHLADAPKFSSPAPLKCTLVTASLDDYPRQQPKSSWATLNTRKRPKYYALSYVWGDPTSAYDIEINGVAAKITKSLHEALCAIRDLTKCRIVWADAICINQDRSPTNVEMSWQLKLMGRIYENADNVLAWLGSPTLESTFAMKALNDIAKILQKTNFRKARRQEDANIYSHHILQQTLTKYFRNKPVELEAIVKLSARTYWTRMWILQEIAASPETIFLCGSDCAKHVNTTLFAIGMFLSYPSCMAGPYANYFKSIPTGVISIMRRRPNFLVENKWAMQLQRRELFYLLFYCNENKQGYGATNKKDYIYALLGLASDEDALDISTKHLSPQPLYNEVIRKLVSAGFADALVFTTTDKQLPGLPSWVPDWSVRGQHVLCTSRTIQPRDTTTNPIVSVSKDLTTLVLQVSPIGTVTSLAPPSPLTQTSTIHDIIAWLELVEAAILLSPTDSSQFWNNPEPIVVGMSRLAQDTNRLARSLYANRDPNNGGKHGDDRAEYLYNLLRTSPRPEALEARAQLASQIGDLEGMELRMYLIAVLQYANAGYRVFRCGTGHVGLLSPKCAVGDVVVRVPGGTVPIVLRKIAGRGDEEVCELVGVAFVDGLKFWSERPALRAVTLR